ncbi:hypothetical protein GH714_013797 [Hevea brasiliensis]|uniref:Uncharacterized protein n=1 Tax=Hevea brasiliensis TaxID=3981 RepID=A0A6A6M872_HEVBR|nr:hypothetical protein GH714_013797 [Hevea brasiliensis]
MGIREIEVAGQRLTIHELDDLCDSITGRPLTGSWLWDSALVLSQWLATSPLDFRGKSVLELGAGTGLPGLTAARLGARLVVLTDVAPLLPSLLRNVEANELGNQVEVRELVWGSDESLSQIGDLGEFDVVLMSDVFFDPEQMGALGSTLKRVCGERSRVWAASEVRPWTGECLNELVSQGFGVVELPSGSRGGDSEADVGQKVFAVYHLIPPTGEKCHSSSNTSSEALSE